MEHEPMSKSSLPAKESIKTGIAMVLACGIAMSIGLMNPYWACFTVVVVSQPTVGESLNKGAVRLLGTLAGGLAGFLILSLFSQDRWAFIGCLSLYMGLCAYRITVSRHMYFWFISSFVLCIVVTTVGTSSQQAFQTAVWRIQETGLGILVYGLVSVFLWPQHRAGELDLTVKTLLTVQANILEHYFSLMRCETGADLAEPMYTQEAQLVGRLKQGLDAAETEQFEIYEVRGWWRQLVSQFQALMEALEVWRESFPELRQMDLEYLMPGLPAFRDALQLRFEQLLAMVDEDPTGQELVAVKVTVDMERLQPLSHFQRAAVMTTHAALEQIESASRSLFECLLAIKSPKKSSARPTGNTPRAVTLRADADSIAAAIRVMSGVWLSALAWIYFDPPGHLMFVVFVAVHSLIKVMAPQLNWLKFFLANSAGVLLTGLLYVFIMPSLSGYLELSLLLFCLTTAIYYIFWDSRFTMIKLGTIAPFWILANVQNLQTYDFTSFSNNAISLLSSIPFAAVISSIPFSQRPEKMFMRLTARYYRQAWRFISICDKNIEKINSKYRIQSGLSAMQYSITKISGWANGIDYRALPANHAEKTEALVASLDTITYRFILLADVLKLSPPLLECFDEDIRAWRIAIQELLPRRTGYPVHNVSETGLRARLETEHARLENRIEKTFQTISAALTEDDYANVYRLLGSYRGIYEALVAHAELAGDFDWECWN